MGLERQTEISAEDEQALLHGDSRWELVQRILASERFQRAAQLRNILSYVSESAILRPNKALSEVEIACDVLQRRSDFNPANDNIVRAQVSHLRNRLKQYFDIEGKDEALVLTIPRGSYIPVFTPVHDRTSVSTASEPAKEERISAAVEEAILEPVQPSKALAPWRKWQIGIGAFAGGAFLLMAVLFWKDQPSKAREDRKANLPNPFVEFLAQSEGPVTVVMPDTSLAMIQHIVGTNISTSDYISNDFPSRQLAMVKDPGMKSVISDLGELRTTSVNEAMIAFDFLKTLQAVGANATILYSRDLHVHELSEGNTILIGGPTSNPWVSIFADEMNFHQVDDPALQKNYFENRHPVSGEQTQYINTYSSPSPGRTESNSVGYVDVTLTQNPSKSGYVLLIDGADLQANEAASRFLLHGKFPSEIASVLSGKHLRYFEFLLHGKHMAGEADDSFELVAFRSQ